MAATAKSTGAAKDPKAAQAAQAAAAKEAAAKNVAANGATAAADDDDNEAGEEEEEGQQGQASRDLNRVRDDGEEAESVDADKLKKSLEKISGAVKELKEKKAKCLLRDSRDAELAAVPIADADVQIIVAELEVSKTVAERTLREHGGKLQEALQALVNAA